MAGGIAFAGSVIVDEIKFVERYPSKSQLSQIIEHSRSIGGAVLNCASSLHQIDSSIPMELIGYIGNDERGKFIQNHLSQFPQARHSLLQIKGNTTFTDVYHDNSDHSRTFFTYKGCSVLFDENTIDFTKIKSAILHIGYLLLLDGLDAEDPIYGTKMAHLLKKAKDAGLETSIDIISEDSDRYQEIVIPALKYTDYCIINEIEAGRTINIDLRDSNGVLQRHLMKQAVKTIKELGVGKWVIIHAPEFSFGYDGKQYVEVESLDINMEEIKGTVGAGDAYATGAIYGAWRGFPLDKSMKIATAAAASSLFDKTSWQSILPFPELLQFFQQRQKK